MSLSRGILVVSLDFELYWGVRDKRSIGEYRENLLGVREAVPAILTAFASHGIHATWATVGLLFFADRRAACAGLPKRRPEYASPQLSPYPYLEGAETLEGAYHFAPGLIAAIRQVPGQEIGTHTFSHYYCLEAGQDLEAFRADLAAAVAVAESQGIELRSLVFPRNQWNPDYLPVLNELGIHCYRGNERSWPHQAARVEQQGRIRRAVRLLDAYWNLTGHHTYPATGAGGRRPYNFPASRFLRPCSRSLALFEGLRLRRITRAMTRAAERREVFHLWWHPHNFGVDLDRNIRFLGRVLEHYESLRVQHGMQSMNMGELTGHMEAPNADV